MTDTSERTQDATSTANELYWGSERSVNQIAEQLDLSKGALYGMIQPLPEGLGCPICGEEVVSANRTARERGMLSCAQCPWKGDADETVALGGEGAPTLPVYADEGDVIADADDALGSPVVDHGRARTLAGGALLGAAVGLALVLWTRRGSRGPR
jgi:transcription elongation factor Elf1